MTDLATIERDDPYFGRDLRESQDAVWRVARWLGSTYGYTVTIPALKERPKIEDRDAYSDCGDLFVYRLHSEPTRRIEVKRRRLTFTGPGDFPYQTMIVDVTHTWDKADPKPAGYVILNEDMTVAALVKAESYSEWQRTERPDRQKGRRRRFLECPLRCAKFVRMAS